MKLYSLSVCMLGSLCGIRCTYTCGSSSLHSAFDESATLTAVILVCCVIALAIGIIWIFFCYCICKTNRDYQTARMVGVVSFHAVVTFLVLELGSPGNRSRACSKTCANHWLFVQDFIFQHQKDNLGRFYLCYGCHW